MQNNVYDARLFGKKTNFQFKRFFLKKVFDFDAVFPFKSELYSKSVPRNWFLINANPYKYSMRSFHKSRINPCICIVSLPVYFGLHISAFSLSHSPI